MASVSEEGDIAVEGEFVGHLKGFTFVPDPGTDASQGRTLRSASIKAVAAEISAKAKRFADVPDTELTLALNGDMVWQDTRIARLHAGDNILKPRIRLTRRRPVDGHRPRSGPGSAERWLATTLKANLEPLQALESADDLDGLARGIAFRLVESLGVLPRDEIADDVKSSTRPYGPSAQIRNTVWGILNLFARTAQTRSNADQAHLVGTATRSQGRSGHGTASSTAPAGTDIGRHRPFSACRILPDGRLPRMRHTCGQDRHAGTAFGSHPAIGVLETRQRGRDPSSGLGRGRWFFGDPGYDVAGGMLGRSVC